jgi:hypothetical protein
MRSTDLWPTPRASEAAHAGRRTVNHRGQTGLAEAVNSGAHRASRPSISSLEASPASRSASPGSNDGWTTIVGYGPSSPEPFASYDPASSSWRTSQASLWEAEWTPYSETWPSSGMTRNGRAFPRRPLVPRTSVTGSGSSEPVGPNSQGYWPTPTTEVSTRSSHYAQGGMPLAYAITRWPTPTTSDGNGAGDHGTGGLDLRTAVQRWPTPQASDHRDRGNMENPSIQRRVAMGKQVNLGMAAGGALNPAWVEWLMGFPPGWTDIGPQNQKASRASLTASSPESTG